MKTSIIILKNILVVIVALFSIKVNAQQREAKAAFNGYKGNYILNLFKPASVAHPDGDVIGFRLDRKLQSEANWQVLQNFETPSTFNQLSDNYKKAKNSVFEFNPLTAYTAEQVWPIFKKNYNYDSLAVYLTQQPLAIAFNILLVDSTAKNNLTYQYRVVQIKKDGSENGKYISLPVSNNINFNADKPHKSARKITGSTFRMEWRAKLTNELPEVLLIKRSKGLKTPFERYLTVYSIEQKGDSVIYAVEDDKISVDELYQYTITPVNRYGGGAKAISDTIQVASLDKQFLIPKIFTATADSINNNIALNWAFIKPDYISAVSVFRSVDYEDGYKLIATTAGYNYVDRNIVSGQKYYYYLVVTDRLSRSTERSIKIYGLSQKSVKSNAPANVSVMHNRIGNTITWTDFNTDSRGFYIYRTNQIAGDLKPITEMIYADAKLKGSYTYTDTATNLSGKIGYAVGAENLSNVRSDYSKLVYVDLPNKTTSLPTITDIKGSDDGYYIFWQDATGTLITTGYNVYRKVGKDEWVILTKTPLLPSKTSFKDIFAVNDLAVSYKMTSINASGVESDFSNEMNASANQPVYPPYSLKSYHTQDLKGIILQWQPSQSTVASYEIYRYQRGKNAVKLATVNGKLVTYTDQNYDRENTNYYYIKTIGTNGQISVPSSETYKTALN